MNLLMQQAIETTAQRFGYQANEILARDRHAHLVRARAVAMLEVRKLGFSYPEIAKAFGRDHTTVIHAVKSALRRIVAEEAA